MRTVFLEMVSPNYCTMLKEEFLQQLLNNLYAAGQLEIYDYTASTYSTSSEAFSNLKSWTDQLVRDKMATFTDAQHTTLEITNYGRYWILKGGYENFLKEGMHIKEHHKEHEEEKFRKEKEDLLEARLRLTHYRLVGFWLTIIISSIGFLLSLYNLYLLKWK